VEQHTGFLQAAPPIDPSELLKKLEPLAKKQPSNLALSQLVSRAKAAAETGKWGGLKLAIRNQVKILQKNQKEDERHLSHCKIEQEENDKGRSEGVKKQEELENEIEEYKSQLKVIEEEIATVKQEMQALQAQRKKATDNRMDEMRKHDAKMMELKAAQNALYKAIQILSDFYKKEALLQAEQRQQHMAVSRGSPPPSTWVSDYKGNKNGLKILKLLAKSGEDFAAEAEESKAQEEDAKKRYEALMTDVADDLNQKVEFISDRSGQEARLQSKMSMNLQDLQSTKELLGELQDQRVNLAVRCDFINKNFDERKNKRNGEIEELHSAIAVLAGAK